MKRLFLPVLALLALGGCASDGQSRDSGDYLLGKIFGNNAGPLFTGETRGEFHDRMQVEEHGFIKDPYHAH